MNQMPIIREESIVPSYWCPYTKYDFEKEKHAYRDVNVNKQTNKNTSRLRANQGQNFDQFYPS